MIEDKNKRALNATTCRKCLSTFGAMVFCCCCYTTRVKPSTRISHSYIYIYIIAFRTKECGCYFCPECPGGLSNAVENKNRIGLFRDVCFGKFCSLSDNIISFCFLDVEVFHLHVLEYELCHTDLNDRCVLWKINTKYLRGLYYMPRNKICGCSSLEMFF